MKSDFISYNFNRDTMYYNNINEAINANLNNYTTFSPIEEKNVSKEVVINNEKSAIDLIITTSGEAAASILVMSARLLNLKKHIKLVVEDSGEIYTLELKKITDLIPDMNKELTSNIANSIKVTIDKFE